jgi:hypothetical protein
MDAQAEQLLEELREERNKFEAQNLRMQELVDTLVELGVYPTNTPAQQKFGYTPMNMVQNWGVDWYRWEEPHQCPHCEADLRDHTNGPPFKREIGQYDQGVDRVTAWRCPECKKDWQRSWIESLKLGVTDGVGGEDGRGSS